MRFYALVILTISLELHTTVISFLTLFIFILGPRQAWDTYDVDEEARWGFSLLDGEVHTIVNKPVSTRYMCREVTSVVATRVFL